MYSNNKKKLFLFNSASGVIQLLLTAILTFVSIPIFISNLGNIQYGIFSAVSVIGNLSIFANLSLDTALIKFISEQGKTEESDHDILTTFLLLLIVLTPLSLLVYLFKDFILLTLLKIPIAFLNLSSVLLKYLLIANFLLILGRTFTAILNAKHKIYLTNLYLFIYSIIYWGGIIIVILKGYGLKEVGLSTLIAAIIWFILITYSALKSWGKFNIENLAKNFKWIAKKQLSYSIKIYTGGLLNFLYEPLTKMLISNLIGISYVGIFEITLKVKSNLQSIFLKLLFPLQPTIAHEQNYDQLREQIKKISLLLFYVIVPLIVILLVCTDSIISLWIGGDNVQLISLSTKIIASLSLLLVTTVTPIYIFLRIKNHPEKEIYIQAANAIINLLVILLTFKQLSYYSVIWGYAASLIIPFSLCIFYQKRYLNFYPFSGIKDLVKYIGYFFVLWLITSLFALIFSLNSWINIIFVSLFCGIISFILLYFFGIINEKMIATYITKIGIKKKFIKQ